MPIRTRLRFGSAGGATSRFAGALIWGAAAGSNELMNSASERKLDGGDAAIGEPEAADGGPWSLYTDTGEAATGEDFASTGDSGSMFGCSKPSKGLSVVMRWDDGRLEEPPLCNCSNRACTRAYSTRMESHWSRVSVSADLGNDVLPNVFAPAWNNGFCTSKSHTT